MKRFFLVALLVTQVVTAKFGKVSYVDPDARSVAFDKANSFCGDSKVVVREEGKEVTKAGSESLYITFWCVAPGESIPKKGA